jgi:Holliday junction resolvase
MVNRKAKGTGAEREIIHQFWKNGWAAIRVAGSGSIRYPTPDIVASNNLRKVAIEVKATKERAQYITKDQVNELAEFCRLFGAEAWIAVRFDNRGWFFVSLEELRETEGAFVLDYEKAKSIGMTFEEFASTQS